MAREFWRNCLYTVGSQTSLAALQALQFVMVARLLGPNEFGLVAGVTAVTAALQPYAGLGMGNVAAMRLARGEASGALFLGNALAVTTASGLVGIGVALAAGLLLFGHPGLWLMILLFGISEIVVGRYIEATAHVLWGQDRHGGAAFVYHVLLLLRVLAAALLYFLPGPPTGVDWAVLQLLATVAAMAVAAVVMLRRVGRPRWDLRMARADARVGAFHSLAASAKGIYTDVDKALLARLAAPEVGGAYTAAYRIVFMAYTPVIAVLLALQGRAFRTGGKAGLQGTAGMMNRVALSGLAYCALVGATLFAAAPLLPLLLGHAYASSTEVLRSLCLLPLLMMVQTVYAQALTAADAQKVVSLLYVGAALVSVGLNVVLIPGHGWQGSVVAAYASQGLLAGAILLYIRAFRGRHAPAVQAAGSAP